MSSRIVFPLDDDLNCVNVIPFKMNGYNSVIRGSANTLYCQPFSFSRDQQKVEIPVSAKMKSGWNWFYEVWPKPDENETFVSVLRKNEAENETRAHTARNIRIMTNHDTKT